MQPRESLDCASCRFYRRSLQSLIATGQCRHSAPIAVPVMHAGVASVATVWPTVEANDSCGQWSPITGASNG